ncbi:MAG: hypothetical protein MUP92_04675 [Actinobacteria bacterium]|nr:hypothetical protein [Actinomycetota bacterium]
MWLPVVFARDEQVTGPAGVMSLLLSATMAGGLWLLFCTPLWNEVKRGFFKLTGSIVVLVGLSGFGSLLLASPSGASADRAKWTILATTVLSAGWLMLLFFRAFTPARIVGILSVPASVAMLWSLAALSDSGQPAAFLQLVCAAAFLGAVMDGLLLGHWYLTDRGLSRTPINRFANILLVATGIEAVAIILQGFEPTGEQSALNPLLTTGGLSNWIALGMVVATGLIAAIIKGALRGQRASAVQSATGFFYLAVLTAFTAVLSSLVGFLPG